jgi:hypothetical protein
MKVFLFLYPIEECFTHGSIAQALVRFRKRRLDPDYINEIIRARYREKGYRITWLLFSDPCDVSVPDFSSLSLRMRTTDGDTFLPCGVDADRHYKERLYPDPNAILSQLPKGITSLVLGGFHQWDCVSKIGEAAHKHGMPVVVDEDTTDHFFLSMLARGTIPIVRPLHCAVDDVLQEATSQAMREIICEQRKDKPWFSQPSTR